jgi:pimeloyl-ACP methyl ester carboxylesterase
MAIALTLALLFTTTTWALWTPDRALADLQARYQTAADETLNLLGNQVRVRDTGPKDAPAVLLLHGFGASLETWEPWALELSRTLRVIRIDLPGSGLSGPDAQGDYSDARSMALLLALLNERHFDRVSVVGHSIGGRIAWTFAATHPTRVAKLVLVAPDGFASPGFVYGQAAEVPASMALMRYTLPRWMLRMSLEPAYADPAALSDALVTRYYELMLAPQSRSAMLERLRQTMLVDPVPLLSSIQAPTLLLWGKQDAMIPFANAADYQRALPHHTLVSFDRVGHLPHEEASARSLVAVQQFLMDLKND